MHGSVPGGDIKNCTGHIRKPLFDGAGVLGGRKEHRQEPKLCGKAKPFEKSSQRKGRQSQIAPEYHTGFQCIDDLPGRQGPSKELQGVVGGDPSASVEAAAHLPAFAFGDAGQSLDGELSVVRLLPDTAEDIVSGGALLVDHAGRDRRRYRKLPVVFQIPEILFFHGVSPRQLLEYFTLFLTFSAQYHAFILNPTAESGTINKVGSFCRLL